METNTQRISFTDDQDQLLQVSIPTYTKEQDGSYHYSIVLLNRNNQDAKQIVAKKYGQFEELHEQLAQMGFQDLPKLPESFFFATYSNLDARRVSLQSYMKILQGRKDTQYSLPLRRFLMLDTFCPELTYKHPQRIMSNQFIQPKRIVTHCKYIEDKDLYLIAVSCNRVYGIELYAMNYRAQPRSQDGKVVSIEIPHCVGKDGSEGKQNERLRLDRLLSVKDLPGKVVAIDFYRKQSQVCVGLQSGQVLVFQVVTEAIPPPSTEQQPIDKKEGKVLSYSFFKRQPQSEIFQTTYWSTVAGEIVFPDLEDFKGPSVQQFTLLKILVSQNPVQLHQKMKSLVISQQKGFLYSSDDQIEQKIIVYDLFAQVCRGQVRYFNCTVSSLLVQDTHQRLFSSTKEGLLLFFDTSSSIPTLAHQMKVVLRPELNKNYIKQMQLDNTKNLLLLRLKNQDILVIQLIGNQAFKSTVIERIKFHTKIEDFMCNFQWLEHLNCYLEGTQQGFLKIRELENAGECRVILDSKTGEQIKMTHYNHARGLIFVASCDGKFQAWKLPSKWRDEKVDKMEEDFVLERKTIARQQRQTMLLESQRSDH